MLKDKLRSRKPADLRAERDELGFVRQPEVRWLSPGLLARSGVEVVVSGTFGKFADKREIQREAQEDLDYSAAAGDVWVDYLSDTGDGWEATYTMAWLLAQPALKAGSQTLPRGRILLLGGDQVYPSATPEQYENRFIGPFASALPRSHDRDDPDKPDMYALPGNHDWYDGLVSFLRVFCAREGSVGDWRTRQRRSYFAVRLPNDWWVWAIDIQLDTYIDDVQLDYFRSQPLAAGDKVVLMTAKPAWVKAVPDRAEPPSWRYLSYFEERVVRQRDAKLAVVITGDLHHYARYEPVGDDDAPTRITAGGGGAYLSPTHTLQDALALRSLDHDASVAYERAQIYPRAEDSRSLSSGILGLARLNPSFAALIGAIYVLLGLAMLGALNAGEGALLDAVGGFGGFLSEAAGGLTMILAVLLFGGVFGATDIAPDALETKGGKRGATRLAKLLVALAHALVHLLLTAALVYLAASVAPDDTPILAWLLSIALLFVAGFAIGATVFAVFLLAIHRIRGPKAREAANQVFTGQSIADYKNLVRMRFAADGSLTLYPLGVDKVGRDWRYEGRPQDGARFEPRAAAPQVHPIDGPLTFDASGRRAR